MDIVFQRDGNAVKRAAIATRFAAGNQQFRFRFLGLAQRDLGGGDLDRTWANAYLWNALLDAALGLLLQ